jgi:hypothetical protein
MARSQSLLRTCLQAGLLAGTLDGIAGLWLYYNATGKNPLGVFPYIASGVFGRAAFGGGGPMLAWGIFFHYLIATLFAVFFVLIAGQVRWLRQHWVLAGLLYGAFVWAVMNLGVVPLSNVSRGPFNLANAILNLGILLVSVGLPISWITNRNEPIGQLSK